MNVRWTLPWLAAAIALLVIATLAGLMRIGWPMPALSSSLIADHGPLMLTGFLGTLITLERAVALRRKIAVLGSAFFALGGVLAAAGWSDSAGKLLTLLGSLWLVGIFVAILRQHSAEHTWVMAAGAVFLAAGSALWVSGRAPGLVVPWWTAFLVLTIAGERLELARILDLSPESKRLFNAAAGLFGAGVVLTVFLFDAGTRVMGLGMFALAAWHLRYDLARRTIRKGGLTRFMAICMLSGYAWLLAGGLLFALFGVELAGPRYDAQIHALFLGFVFSMIFGHAPVIFPAILNRTIGFHNRYYAHWVLLQASLLVRLLGDLNNAVQIRRWGGMLNGIALLAFLANTAFGMLSNKDQ